MRLKTVADLFGIFFFFERINFETQITFSKTQTRIRKMLKT